MENWHPLGGIAQPFSSISHFVGAVLFLTLSFFMLRDARRTGGFWAYFIYAASAVLLLTISGIAHMFPPASQARQILFRLDLTAIFLLIAGTFTPIHWVLFRGWRRWSVLVPIWLIAVTGIYLRLVYFESISYIAGTTIFIAMGWVGVFSGILIRLRYGPGHTAALLAGGVCYTLGAIIDAVKWPVVIPLVVGPHELFHLLVLAGLGFHWSFISRIASGKTSSSGVWAPPEKRPPQSTTVPIQSNSPPQTLPPVKVREAIKK